MSDARPGYATYMPITRAVARPMLAGIFVAGGIDAIRNPHDKVKKAEAVADPLGHPVDTATMVRLNGAVQVGAAAMLATGRLPRLSAAVLAGSLIPTTYAGHRFWEEDSAATKAQQQFHFLKNVAILGGLVLATADSGKRESLAARAGHAVAAAPEAVLDAARDTSSDLAKEAVQAAREISREASKTARAGRKAAKRTAANAAVVAAALSSSRRGRKRTAAKRARMVFQGERWMADKARDALHSGVVDQARDGAVYLAHAAGQQARKAKLPIAS